MSGTNTQTVIIVTATKVWQFKPGRIVYIPADTRLADAEG